MIELLDPDPCCAGCESEYGCLWAQDCPCHQKAAREASIDGLLRDAEEDRP